MEELTKAVEQLIIAVQNTLTCLNCGGTGTIVTNTFYNGSQTEMRSKCHCRTYAQTSVTNAYIHLQEHKKLEEKYSID